MVDTLETLPLDLSYEDFLNLGDELRAEWVGGKVVPMSPPSSRHQRLTLFLANLLQLFVEKHDLGVVIVAPFQMKLETRPSGREPDILFVAKANLERLKKNYLDGPADFVVEIISPESRARDRGDKYYEYEGAGVREYWLLDPERKQVEFYQLGDDGIYKLVPAQEGTYTSKVFENLRLEVAMLWQEPLPKVLDVLKTWKLL